jgi:hypothetical protein
MGADDCAIDLSGRPDLRDVRVPWDGLWFLPMEPLIRTEISAISLSPEGLEPHLFRPDLTTVAGEYIHEPRE